MPDSHELWTAANIARLIREEQDTKARAADVMRRIRQAVSAFGQAEFRARIDEWFDEQERRIAARQRHHQLFCPRTDDTPVTVPEACASIAAFHDFFVGPGLRLSPVPFTYFAPRRQGIEWADREILSGRLKPYQVVIVGCAMMSGEQLCPVCKWEDLETMLNKVEPREGGAGCRSAPMTKAEIARRYLNRERAKGSQARAFMEARDLRQEPGTRLWTIRTDDISDPATRARFERKQ